MFTFLSHLVVGYCLCYPVLSAINHFFSLSVFLHISLYKITPSLYNRPLRGLPETSRCRNVARIFHRPLSRVTSVQSLQTFPFLIYSCILWCFFTHRTLLLYSEVRNKQYYISFTCIFLFQILGILLIYPSDCNVCAMLHAKNALTKTKLLSGAPIRSASRCSKTNLILLRMIL